MARSRPIQASPTACRPRRPRPSTPTCWSSSSRRQNSDAVRGFLERQRRSHLCERRRSSWHDCGMSRKRLSTTVDEDLLQAARRVRSGDTDAAMIDEALRALVARHRSAEVEASYTAYDDHPLDEPDEWRDLASFRGAARVRSSAVSADWGALSLLFNP